MVLNREFLHKRDYKGLFNDIHGVVTAAPSIPIKVILETSELSRDEKVIAVAIAKAAGVAFVKTSTGFSKCGATEEDVRLMRAIAGADIGVKASGGIRTLKDALCMIEAGASRIGSSASVSIIGELRGVGPAASRGEY
jgi:deoxyribose-phosphate aldolase